MELSSLFLKRAADKLPVGSFQLTLEVLVHGEGDGLTGGDTHHTRGDTLVEGAGTLGLEHVAGDDDDAGDGGLAGLGAGLLQTGLDGVDGGVGEGTDGTGDQTDEGRLVRGQLGVGVLGLVLLQGGLELGVGREVGGLVGTLAEGGQGDTAVEDAEALLADDGEERVRGAAVLGGVEGISQTVVLRLQTDLDHFHGVDDGDSLGDTSGKTGYSR